MPIKASEIPGFLVEKKENKNGKDCICHAHSESECGCGADWSNYYEMNTAISLMSERSIGLNREKLISLIKELLLTPKSLDRPKPTIAELEKILNAPAGESLAILPNGEIATVRPQFSIEKLADAIIAREGTILEVKND